MFLTLCLLINALDVASPLVMPIVFLYLQLHNSEQGRLALLYLQFVYNLHYIALYYIYMSMHVLDTSEIGIQTDWCDVSCI